MNSLLLRRYAWALCASLLLCAPFAQAQEALIRKNLAERMPDLPKIDEVSKTAVPGLYEVRIGSSIFYADEAGNHLIEGILFETKTRTNLTEVRQNKLNAIDVSSLPMKDAIVWKQEIGRAHV